MKITNYLNPLLRIDSLPPTFFSQQHPLITPPFLGPGEKYLKPPSSFYLFWNQVTLHKVGSPWFLYPPPEGYKRARKSWSQRNGISLEVGQFATIDKIKCNGKHRYIPFAMLVYRRVYTIPWKSSSILKMRNSLIWKMLPTPSKNNGETGKPAGLKNGGKLDFQGYRISFNITFYHPLMIFDSHMKYPCD